ncbi:MAG TPA: hypothetical protein DIS66_00425 [Candidatus Omnitrophica bacterium]|nr:hypothetical protein [Candidatus Omnitrophota bacterium]
MPETHINKSAESVQNSGSPKSLSSAQKENTAKTAVEQTLAQERKELQNLIRQRDNQRNQIEKLQERRKKESEKQKKETNKKISALQNQVKSLNKQIEVQKNSVIPKLEQQLSQINTLLSAQNQTPPKNQNPLPGNPAPGQPPVVPNPNTPVPVSPAHQIAGLRTQLSENLAQQTEIQNQINSVDSEIELHDSRIKELNEEIKSLNEQNQTLVTAAAGASEKTVGERIQEISDELSANDQFISDLEQDSDTAEGGIERLADEANKLNEEIESVHEKIFNLQMDALEPDPVTNQINLAKNDSQIFDLELEISNIETEITSIDDQIERYQDRIMENDRMIDAIKGINFQLRGELQELQGRDPQELLYPESTVQDTLEMNQLRAEEIQREIDSHQNQKSQLESQKNELRQSLDNLKNAASQIESQIESLQAQPAA